METALTFVLQLATLLTVMYYEVILLLFGLQNDVFLKCIQRLGRFCALGKVHFIASKMLSRITPART